MFKKISLCFFLTLFLGGTMALADQTTDEAKNLPVPAPTLAAVAGDDVALLKMKAALRLMSAFTAINQAGKNCLAENADFKSVFINYSERNGNTVATILTYIKKAGGINAELKKAVEKETTDRLKQFSDLGCPNFQALIDDGALDLYKGSIFVDDYNFLRADD